MRLLADEKIKEKKKCLVSIGGAKTIKSGRKSISSEQGVMLSVYAVEKSGSRKNLSLFRHITDTEIRNIQPEIRRDIGRIYIGKL